MKGQGGTLRRKHALEPAGAPSGKAGPAPRQEPERAKWADGHRAQSKPGLANGALCRLSQRRKMPGRWVLEPSFVRQQGTGSPKS